MIEVTEQGQNSKPILHLPHSLESKFHLVESSLLLLFYKVSAYGLILLQVKKNTGKKTAVTFSYYYELVLPGEFLWLFVN